MTKEVAPRGINIVSEKNSTSKLIDFSSAAAMIRNLRDDKKTVVYVDGVFDLLHVGHLGYVEQASKAGNILMVGIKPDSMVRRNKGASRPIQTHDNRARLIAALGVVDIAFVLPEQEELSYPEWRKMVLSQLNPIHYAIMEADGYLEEKMNCIRNLNNDTTLLLLQGPPKSHSTTDIVKKIRGGL